MALCVYKGDFVAPRLMIEFLGFIGAGRGKERQHGHEGEYKSHFLLAFLLDRKVKKL